MTPRIAVVVPTYQHADRLPALVAALEAQTLPATEFEAIIVDDGSRDSTAEVLNDLASRTAIQLRAVILPLNRRPAAARNEAWRSSDAPIFAFTDDDCSPAPTWLEAGLRRMDAEARLGVLQGRTTWPPDREPQSAWDAFRSVEGPTPWFEGCNLFVRRDTLEEVGGFDETMEWYGEDTALGWSALASGWNRGFEAVALVVHDVEYKGPRWFAERAYEEGKLVDLAVRYPALANDGFWRPWAVHPDNLLYPVALLGLVGARIHTASLGLTLPWLLRRWPRGPFQPFASTLAGRAAVDSARLAGMIRASIRNRRLVL